MLKRLSSLHNYHESKLTTFMTSITNRPDIVRLGVESKILYYVRKSIQYPKIVRSFEQYQDNINKYYTIQEYPLREPCSLVDVELFDIHNYNLENRYYVQELQMISFYVRNYSLNKDNETFIEFCKHINYSDTHIAYLIKRIMRRKSIPDMLTFYHEYKKFCCSEMNEEYEEEDYLYPSLSRFVPELSRKNYHSRKLSDLLFYAMNYHCRKNNKVFQVFVGDCKLSDVEYHIDHMDQSMTISERMKLYTKFMTVYNALLEIGKQNHVLTALE